MEIDTLKIQSILDRIIPDLETEANLAPHPSVFAGYGGPILFFTYLTKYTNTNKYLPVINDLVTRCFDFAQKNEMNFSMENGLTGIGWLLQHLVNCGIVDEDETILSELDALILKSCAKDLRIKKYDYFTGLIGKGIYFIERHASKDCGEQIRTILSAIESLVIRDEFGITWADYYAIERPGKNDLAFNFGMSHGVPSILMFLSKLMEQDIEKERVATLLNESLNWLLHFPVKKESTIFFPVRMINYDDLFPDDEPARIAWCYGDLGLTYALYRAGKTINREDVCMFALSILQKLSTERKLQNCGVVDAGLCHGSAGIALIFENLYEDTGDRVFRNASLYWIEETGKLSVHPDGAAGYKAWHGDELGGWVSDRGFLEGTSGIGLLFLTVLNRDAKAPWSKLLLLN